MKTPYSFFLPIDPLPDEEPRLNPRLADGLTSLDKAHEYGIEIAWRRISPTCVAGNSPFSGKWRYLSLHRGKIRCSCEAGQFGTPCWHLHAYEAEAASLPELRLLPVAPPRDPDARAFVLPPRGTDAYIQQIARDFGTGKEGARSIASHLNRHSCRA